MKKIDEFRKFFKIDWRSVRIGWQGVKYHGQQITNEEVLEYSYELLEKKGGEPGSLVVELAGVSSIDSDSINVYLNKLAPVELESDTIAVRKWRWLLLKILLNSLSKKYDLYELLKFGDFWAEFDYPIDMPDNAIQALRNDLTPNEYYSQDNYDSVIYNHKKWLEEEYYRLNSLDKKGG